MKRLSLIGGYLFIVAAISLSMVASALATEPWIWKMTLETGTASQTMDRPTALYIDAEKKRYYVVDSGRSRLLSFDESGTFLHAFNADGNLQTPYDMVRDAKEVIWIVEKGRNTLTSIDVANQSITRHVLKAGERTLVPSRIAILKDKFYVLDQAQGEVAVVNAALEVEKWFTCQDCRGGVVDFQVAKNGSLLALDQLGEDVVFFDSDGTLLRRIHVGQYVKFPSSLAVGPSGLVYVLDRHEGSISVFDTKGSFKYSFLSFGELRGQLYFPIEILFDPWGNLCVVEEGNGRVEIFSR
ncbi:MAG: hypothetical protein KQH63_17395 [Desulfobulbaceae bacterium]|nr:hypothetical protein [Desulfobulbaceae bacterium]